MRRGAQHAHDRDAHNAQGCAIVRSHAQWKMRGGLARWVHPGAVHGWVGFPAR